MHDLVSTATLILMMLLRLCTTSRASCVENRVVSAKKVSNSAGGLNDYYSLSDGDSFGSSLSVVGDLDGDGVDDIAVGAKYDSHGGMYAGAVYILFGNVSGGVKDAQKISSLYGSPSTNGGLLIREFDYFGSSVAGVGDLDGDSVPDLVVGSPGANCNACEGSLPTGNILILLLNADGTVKSVTPVDDRAMPLDEYDQYGSSVSSLGDVDDDGTFDIIVGARLDDGGNANAGTIYILFMSTGSSVRAFQKISNTYGSLSSFYYLGEEIYFGASCTFLSLNDVAVGAPSSTGGAVFILSLTASGIVQAAQLISNQTASFSNFYTLSSVSSFGSSVSNPGDIDGDGNVDLVVGAAGISDDGIKAGAVFALFLNANYTVHVAQKFSETLGGLSSFYSLGGGDKFGSSSTVLNVTKDSVQLVVGAIGKTSSTGAVYFLSLGFSEKMTCSPSMIPSRSPTQWPLPEPTNLPSPAPTSIPTLLPSQLPTFLPSLAPMPAPTLRPVPAPTTLPSPAPTSIPTLLPSQMPTFLPSLAPMPAPTLRPVPAPTTLPSPAPTSIPTLLPSQLPTFLPSLMPMPAPTTLPFPSPTVPAPTSLPSPEPSPAPTQLPSQIPSPIPTVNCEEAGHSFDGTTCSTCPPGRYSDIIINSLRICIVCSPGFYAPVSGNKNCSECLPGKLSSSDRTLCSDCSPGEYTFNKLSCQKCPRGTYAPQALSGECLNCTAGFFASAALGAASCTACGVGTASNLGERAVHNCSACPAGKAQGASGQTSCNDCSTGKASAVLGATSCSLCSSGKWSAKGNASCAVCSPGRYSSEGASACQRCTQGTASSGWGSAVCTVCSPGSFADSMGAIICTDCPTGRAQSVPGQDRCIPCEAGKFAKSTRAELCNLCDGEGLGFFSFEDSSECNQCQAQYYRAPQSGNCVSCSSIAKDSLVCQDTVGGSLPAPSSGFWIDYTGLSDTFESNSLKVYSCSRQTCKGYTSGLELCLRNASTLARCNQGGVLDNLLCTSGAYGPLCHSCLRDFSFSITTGGCELCRTSWLLPTLIVLTGLLLAGLIVSVKWGFLELPKFVNHARFLGIAKVSSCFCYLHM